MDGTSPPFHLASLIIKSCCAGTVITTLNENVLYFSKYLGLHPIISSWRKLHEPQQEFQEAAAGDSGGHFTVNIVPECVAGKDPRHWFPIKNTNIEDTLSFLKSVWPITRTVSELIHFKAEFPTWPFAGEFKSSFPNK